MKEKINAITKSRLNYKLPITLPISNEDLSNFSKKFKLFFNYEVPDFYLEFIKVSNGLEENGILIYSATDNTENKVVKGIFENNKLWYEQDSEDMKYIFFAESDQDLFVFNKTSNKYLLIDRYSGDVYETFLDFNHMILHIIDKMINM